MATWCPSPSLPPSHPPSHHHCQIPQETHLKSYVHSLITLSLVRERDREGGQGGSSKAKGSWLLGPNCTLVFICCRKICLPSAARFKYPPSVKLRGAFYNLRITRSDSRSKCEYIILINVVHDLWKLFVEVNPVSPPGVYVLFISLLVKTAMSAMTFSRVESSSLSVLHLLSSSSHHFESPSVLACSFVSGWLQLQDVLYGQCFWVLWIPVIMGEALSVQWTFVVRDVRTHTLTHTYIIPPPQG